MPTVETPELVPCDCGRITNTPCAWSGPAADTVIIEWMPPFLRASHEAAGNRGVYPHNGAERLRVASACADLIINGDSETEGDAEWTARL